MPSKRSARARRPSLERIEPRTVLSAVIAYPQSIWPTNQIPYVIDPSIKDPLEIIEAINEYNDQTTTQWIPRTNQTDYVDFKYVDLPGLDEAEVGDHHDGEQYVALNNADLTYIVLHEMGHALGLLHEQSRLDASQYILINYQNLFPGDAAVWQPDSPSEVKDVGPYDYSSIMEYNGYIGSANGLPVATELNGTPLPLNTTLSAEDISTLDSLYPAQAGQAQVPRQVSATSSSPDKIELTWTDTNRGQATYTVERAAAGGTFQSIATVPAGSTSYVDDKVGVGTVYEYMIVATTAANVPAVSQIVYATAAAPAPTNLIVSESSGSATLSWTDHSGGTASYVIELSQEYDGSSSPFVPYFGTQPAGSTSYTIPASWLAGLSWEQLTFRVYAYYEMLTPSPMWISGDSNTVTLDATTGGGGGGSGGQVTAPQVLGVVKVEHTKKKVSSVTIAFNEAMVPASVSNSALYSVFGGVPKRRRVVFSKKIKIRSVLYDEAADTVSITLAKPYKGQVKVSLAGIIEATDGASSDIAFSADVR
jgi:hypothetical protein